MVGRAGYGGGDCLFTWQQVWWMWWTRTMQWCMKYLLSHNDIGHSKCCGTCLQSSNMYHWYWPGVSCSQAGCIKTSSVSGVRSQDMILWVFPEAGHHCLMLSCSITDQLSSCREFDWTESRVMLIINSQDQPDPLHTDHSYRDFYSATCEANAEARINYFEG